MCHVTNRVDLWVGDTSRKYQGRDTEDFIAAKRAAWGANPVQFEGTYYTIPPSNIDPKPVQLGGIPIIMGGFSLAALKLAAPGVLSAVSHPS